MMTAGRSAASAMSNWLPFEIGWMSASQAGMVHPQQCELAALENGCVPPGLSDEQYHILPAV
jgi:hypothetical protein